MREVYQEDRSTVEGVVEFAEAYRRSECGGSVDVCAEHGGSG
jgi:hypothetical protein